MQANNTNQSQTTRTVQSTTVRTSAVANQHIAASVQQVVNNAHDILESQVKDVIASAKVKIEEIQREIETLNVEYEHITI
jgi:hypothetical protein